MAEVQALDKELATARSEVQSLLAEREELTRALATARSEAEGLKAGSEGLEALWMEADLQAVLSQEELSQARAREEGLGKEMEELKAQLAEALRTVRLALTLETRPLPSAYP